ncbi:MAG: DUF6445 family protein [Hyphomonadaceae bacterium]|nr:DUF6445 family protein [Hyphomonadaceae bacterium]
MPERYDIRHFGNEGEPVVIIDDFASDPGALFEAACAKSYQPIGPYYPGIRAQADPGYLSEHMELFADVLPGVFGLENGAHLSECAFSLVTTPRDALAPIQRIPHFDSTSPKILALLHYLCDETGGGTAFYRHRSTGFETISETRHRPYDTALRTENAQNTPTGYVDGDTSLFEETGRVKAKFNRMAIYRGYRLHSGVIPEDLSLSADPREGRLTVNTFFQGR